MKRLDDRGSIPMILCILITGLLAFTAYVVDIGLVYAEKAKISKAIDAAVLAAVIELPNGDVKTINVANEYLKANGVAPEEVIITISTDRKKLHIKATKNVNHLFAQVIGISSSEVNVETEAVLSPIESVKLGIKPFAVEAYEFSYGDLITLKEGGGNGYHGNYGAVALGGSGANVFRGNAIYGYNGTISIGDYIDTEPGNMAGATNDIKNYINSENSTFDSFPNGSIRLWTVPIVDSLDVKGRKKVLVIGFAQFYVEAVGNKGGKIEIQGRFKKYVTSSGENSNNTGIYEGKLAQ